MSRDSVCGHPGTGGLGFVADLLANGGPELSDVRMDLDAARAELRELARGIHPSTLTSGGLPVSLPELAARSPVPVKLTVPAVARGSTDARVLNDVAASQLAKACRTLRPGR